jgi:FKBP-type peptidyl-prolyl cis-trans isomerase
MKKTLKTLLTISLIAAFAVMISSCKKSEPQPVTAGGAEQAAEQTAEQAKETAVPVEAEVSEKTPQEVASEVNEETAEVVEETKEALANLAAEPEKKSEIIEKTAKETEQTLEQINKSAQKALEENMKPGMEVLEIDLPKPMFVGTPQDLKVKNLEPARGEPRPPFLVPEGTKNVALNKPVMSSDDMPIIGEIEMITDGDKEAAEGSYVELGPFLQHVTIDLEGEYEIYAVVVWHFHKQASVYFDVVVQLGNDPDLLVDPVTIFNNDHDNSSGLGIGKDKNYIETFEGKLINAGGKKAKYVKLYSNGNTANELNHYIEVEVYGKPVE